MKKQNQEDYLHSMYSLYENNTEISSVDLANSLNVSKSAVSKMLKKFVVQKLIKMEPYSTIKFTAKGLREAGKIMYKHRVIECFLVKILGYKNLATVHEEAHRLEHSFSDESIKRIDSLMKYPQKTSTGKIILRKK